MMEKLIKKLNNRKGFTLIELIVVIAIIGILAAILIPQFTGFTDKAKATEALVAAKQVATAYDAYIAEKGKPASDALAVSDAKPVVVKMSGVATGDITTFTADGGFVVTKTTGGKTTTAGRTTQGAVEVIATT